MYYKSVCSLNSGRITVEFNTAVAINNPQNLVLSIIPTNAYQTE